MSLQINKATQIDLPAGFVYKIKDIKERWETKLVGHKESLSPIDVNSCTNEKVRNKCENVRKKRMILRRIAQAVLSVQAKMVFPLWFWFVSLISKRRIPQRCPRPEFPINIFSRSSILLKILNSLTSPTALNALSCGLEYVDISGNQEKVSVFGSSVSVFMWKH